MKLYFNGCSLTYGDDLDDKSLAWPSLLAKHYKSEHWFNDSISGGSNDRIVFNTVQNIENFDKFYIAWTYITRFTRYCSADNGEVNFNVNGTHALLENMYEYKQYAKLHYSHWYSELYALKCWLQQTVLLQSLFKQHNKAYKMIYLVDNDLGAFVNSRDSFQTKMQKFESFNNLSDDILDKEYNDIIRLVNSIDVDNCINWNQKDINIDHVSELYPIGPTKHPLEQGHQHIANYILKHDTI